MSTPTPRRSSRAARAFTAVLALAPLAAAQGGLQGATAVGPRALYVWDIGIPGDRGASKELLNFATERRIDTLYLESAPVGYGLPDAAHEYSVFVDRAHGQGLEVYALIGNPWFTVPRGSGVPGQPTDTVEGLNIVRRLTEAAVDFDGLIDNSMPYLTDWEHEGETGNWFWDHLPQSAQGYLDYLHGVDALLGDMPFHHAIPFWFDMLPELELALDGSPEPRPLNVHVAAIVDVTNVLAYRDQAHGPVGILAISAGELLQGPTTIGVETMSHGPAGAFKTFWEEGRGALERELHSVWNVHGGQTHFRGFTLHYYGSLRALRE